MTHREPLYPPLVRAALQSSLRAFEKHRRLIVSQTDGEALILQRASVSRTSGQWRDDDDVLEDGLLHRMLRASMTDA
jgi:hypothetical protein